MIDRRNGTIQSERLSKDLLDSTFRIDNRSPWELLNYIALYLEKLNYFDANNDQQGNWKKLVEHDPVIYMSLIINEPTGEIDKLITQINQEHLANKDQLHHSIKGTILEWIEKIDKWQKQLERLDQPMLAAKIDNSLKDILSSPQADLQKSYDQFLDERSLVPINPKNLSTPTEPAHIVPKPDQKFSKKDLDTILKELRKVIAHIQKITKKYVILELEHNNEHLPNNALYIAFALLFKVVQDKLNHLSRKHLDFYYRDILQQESAPGEPSKAIVNFDLLPEIKASEIPAGTKLSAGKFPGTKTEVIFETKDTLIAQEAQLVNLQTLLFNSNPHLKVGTNQPLISSAQRNYLMSHGKSLIGRDNWYLFGANKTSIKDDIDSNDESAKIGFMVGSPVLHLKEGNRKISIRVNLEAGSANDVLWTLLDEMVANNSLPFDVAFYQVFRKGFKIAYTGIKEWIAVEKYDIKFSREEQYIAFEIDLESTAPALVQNPELLQHSVLPSIRIELDEMAPIYGYSFLKDVRFDTIKIDVAVSGIKDVSLYNNIGKMPAGKPFELFGPEPMPGGYLMVGHSELFQKKLDQLTVDLEWESVPKAYGGLDTYYSDYSYPINNESFKVALSILSNHMWLPYDKAARMPQELFATTKVVTPQGYESCLLNNTTTIPFDKLHEIDVALSNDLKDPIAYNVTTPNGFIKLTFTAPEVGFGSEIYQKDYAAIANANARRKRKIDYPNKPFVPKLGGLQLSYTASDTISLTDRFNGSTNTQPGNSEFLHITPYIEDKVVSQQEVLKLNRLLPQFEQNGYLIMGLMGVKSKSNISIYFDLLRSSTANMLPKDALTWEYFKVPKWKAFKKEDIIIDNTRGFLSSGIIEILLPDVTGKDRGINEDVLWIRASVKENMQHYPKIKGIYLNAVEAVCINKEPEVIGELIDARKIVKVKDDLPDVKSVYQAAKSYGGRPKESNKDHYTRVSERLRHKGRAVSIWDYERLLLNRFEDVRIAKCTNLNEDFHPVPGNVKVVVLSRKWTKEERFYFSQQRLDEMKNYLNKICSSFIDIEVRNPSIEYVLVNCVVKFKAKYVGGFYRQKLNDAISEYLSPINNMKGHIGGIGGKVVPMMVASYIEGLPYIEKLERLSVEHIIREGGTKFSKGVHENEVAIIANKPWSILSPVKEHRIILSGGDKKPKISNIGVGMMQIGLDFIVGEEHHPQSEKLSKGMVEEPFEKALAIDARIEFKNEAGNHEH